MFPRFILVLFKEQNILLKFVGKHNSIDVTIDDRLIELDMGKFTGMFHMMRFLQVMEMSL